MKNLNKVINWKIYIIIIFFIILSGLILFWLFNTNLQKSIDAVLEVDKNKNFVLVFDNSNIQQVNGSKNVYISLEKKMYLLQNVKYTFLGNNRYAITFDNEELIDVIKSQSLFNVKIFLDSKSIFDIIFNII